MLLLTYVRHASLLPRISKNASSWGRKNADRRVSTSPGSPSSSYTPWMDQPMRSSNEGNVLDAADYQRRQAPFRWQGTDLARDGRRVERFSAVVDERERRW